MWCCLESLNQWPSPHVESRIVANNVFMHQCPQVQGRYIKWRIHMCGHSDLILIRVNFSHAGTKMDRIALWISNYMTCSISGYIFYNQIFCAVYCLKNVFNVKIYGYLYAKCHLYFWFIIICLLQCSKTQINVGHQSHDEPGQSCSHLWCFYGNGHWLISAAHSSLSSLSRGSMILNCPRHPSVLLSR